MANITSYGSVSETGILTLNNRKRLQTDLLMFKNCAVELVIRKKNKRSTPQNSYYHGVVVAEVRHGLLEIGYPMTADETHEFLKQRFNSTQIITKDGLVIDVPRSTTELNKSEFSEYVERIAQFAAEYLSVNIPMPNENLTLKL